MAFWARSSPDSFDVIDLRDVTGADLDPLLRELNAWWRARADWDQAASTELLRRYLDMRALDGFVVLTSSGVSGLAYYVQENDKALLGDLFVRDSPHSTRQEQALIEAVLAQLRRRYHRHRLEAQPIALREPFGPQPGLSRYPRALYSMHLERLASLRERDFPLFEFRRWDDIEATGVATLIMQSYRGHVDSRINDQYDSISGALRFLSNVVQYPGCGQFFEAGTLAAVDLRSGALGGVVMASLIAAGVGHITQLCVAPEAKGTGLGYELLRRSMTQMYRDGARRTSLTVTLANTKAVRLYEQVGFRLQRNFDAYVWEW